MDARVMRGALALVAMVAIAVPAIALSAHKKKLGYVTTELRVPMTVNETEAFSRDVDGDGSRDNALGEFFASLTQYGVFDEQSVLDDAIADGRLLMLHSLKTPSLKKTKEAKWQVFYGLPDDSPDYSGSGSFQVVSSPRSDPLPTKIKNGHVKTAVGTVPLRLDIGNGIFTLTLTNARIFATCSKFSCSDGRITGAITAQQINSILIPEFIQYFNPVIMRDCPGPTGESCQADSQGKMIQQFFDANDDMEISADELRENEVARLVPDLDLVKDGEPDAMSLGLGFQTVKAKLIK